MTAPRSPRTSALPSPILSPMEIVSLVGPHKAAPRHSRLNRGHPVMAVPSTTNARSNAERDRRSPPEVHRALLMPTVCNSKHVSSQGRNVRWFAANLSMWDQHPESAVILSRLGPYCRLVFLGYVNPKVARARSLSVGLEGEIKSLRVIQPANVWPSGDSRARSKVTSPGASPDEEPPP